MKSRTILISSLPVRHPSSLENRLFLLLRVENHLPWNSFICLYSKIALKSRSLRPCRFDSLVSCSPRNTFGIASQCPHPRSMPISIDTLTSATRFFSRIEKLLCVPTTLALELSRSTQQRLRSCCILQMYSAFFVVRRRANSPKPNPKLRIPRLTIPEDNSLLAFSIACSNSELEKVAEFIEGKNLPLDYLSHGSAPHLWLAKWKSLDTFRIVVL